MRPTPVAWTRLRAPESLMDAAPAEAMAAAVAASPLTPKYAEAIDRESARELLAKKLEEGARKAAEDARVQEMAREQKNERVTTASRKKAAKEQDSMVETVVKSTAFKDFMRTAAREIARGMFKSGRRSRLRSLRSRVLGALGTSSSLLARELLLCARRARSLVSPDDVGRRAVREEVFEPAESSSSTAGGRGSPATSSGRARRAGRSGCRRRG